ncbi:MAG TPA: hypothetical protein VKG80_14915 [Trebonia sp.]|nr:hypothetical protein [Trebonia sp.]
MSERAAVHDDPFRALGLPPRADLSDDDVRAAWRRIAAATHPDRDDGGDPARFGAAAAAYAMLRTSYGRSEALADLGPRGVAGLERGPSGHRGWDVLRGRGAWPGRTIRFGVASAGSRGRTGLLALRVVATTTVCAAAFVIAGWAPASIGVLAGMMTWLIGTGRHDIGPRSRR